jgi:hypothetical protein
MKYRAPRGNREYATWPAVSEMPALVERNREILRQRRGKVLGVSIADFTANCRRELLDAARAYAAKMHLPCPADSHGPIIATGHQGEFYHAGVWIKNHLAFSLARFLGGASLNLVVDNDVPKHLGLVLPDLAGEAPRRVLASLGEIQPDLAFEEYASDFPDPEGFTRVALKAAAGTPFEDSARSLVGRIVSTRGRGASIADVNTLVRTQYEREAGVISFELPVSVMCGTDTFLAFALSICLDAGAFASAHNEALRRFRQENHVRYAMNPIPDLALVPRCETPFWVWKRGQRRQRLFAAADGSALKLFDSGGELVTVSTRDLDDVAGFRRTLARDGLKIRPRAVSLTLFARLFGCDLFVHGIGGAKYDEVTDRIVEGFYDCPAPSYAVSTATMHLPWGFSPIDECERTVLTRKLRDIKHNPERLVTAQEEESGARVARKRQIVASAPSTAEGRRAKWLEIRAINEALAGRLASIDKDARLRLEELDRDTLRDEVAFSREYSCFLVGAEAVSAFYREALAPLIKGHR